jgi:hypothetical protein
MGGSLPGATGMMYARTAGAAPSEGPYAKKTMPSAQDGGFITLPRKETIRPDVEGPAGLLSTEYLKSFLPEYKRLTGVPNAPNDMYDRMYTDLAYGRGMDQNNAAFITSFLESNYDALGNLKRYTSTPPEKEYTEEERIESARREKEAYERNKRVAPPGAGTEYQNGGSMSYYQHGLDWKPRNISRDGSVVKDNMGYWNPDNWGRVVEIDSPNITMQGVNQPLLGISDKGDVQYMEPGKDYKFKGKKVTEYPLAKGGVSINRADEYPLQKLDDLLNFTNYNKPKAKSGGWLDKY